MPASASRADSGYGRLDRLFHRLALGGNAVPDLSFDLEQARFGRAAAQLQLQAPVFVTGLARAGTTILMRLLHAHSGFAALSYRDLPFPLAPNCWAALSARSRRDLAPQERGHGDGLFHDLDSPEAIEEIFWRVQEGQRYRQADALLPTPPEPPTIEAFRRYVRLVCLRHGGARYLSKNNANILRLPALVEAFPDAMLVHPFRDPVDQAASLLDQHRRACALAAKDRFRGDFMRWLGHHEFGAAQRRFALPGGPAADADPGTLDYWLQSWTAVYQHLLDQPAPVAAAQNFIDYDRLKTGDPALLGSLGRALGLMETPDGAMLRPALRTADPSGLAPALIASARAVHDRLIERAAMVA